MAKETIQAVQDAELRSEQAEQEGREKAAAILAEAEQQARQLVWEAEEQAYLARAALLEQAKAFEKEQRARMEREIAAESVILHESAAAKKKRGPKNNSGEGGRMNGKPGGKVGVALWLCCKCSGLAFML